MFENFSFLASPAQSPVISSPSFHASHSSSSSSRQCSNAEGSMSATKANLWTQAESPPTPPLSPTDSDCFSSFGHPTLPDPLTSTLSSLGLASGLYPSPETSDSDSDHFPTEDVRRKRQTMARLQTDEVLLMQLGEMVRKISSKGSAATGDRHHSAGVSKKGSLANKPRSASSTPRSRSSNQPHRSRQTKGSGRRPCLGVAVAL